MQKAIVGMNLEEIKRRKDPKSDFRTKLRDEAKKEVADKKKKQIEKRRENRKAQNKQKDKNLKNVPKKAQKGGPGGKR